MTTWVVNNLGPDIPMHFSGFHPDWKMMDKPRTPKSTLQRAREIALSNGVRYAYTGNVYDFEGHSTYCHSCQDRLIGRDWYQLSDWNIRFDGNYSGNCVGCGEPVAGIFEQKPGDWGRKRMRVQI